MQAYFLYRLNTCLAAMAFLYQTNNHIIFNICTCTYIQIYSNLFSIGKYFNHSKNLERSCILDMYSYNILTIKFYTMNTWVFSLYKMKYEF